MTKLEDQMITWTPQDGTSPDRMDALVWAVTELTDNFQAQAWIDHYRRKAEASAADAAAVEQVVEAEIAVPDEPEDPVAVRKRARDAAFLQQRR
jgi:hypothetical protein